ncbi:hypothetical protein PINS_up020295 [Pythium insidiosum]|nr:hypothetical protein PINS_up020295 [Pythium insidiosum]
MGAISIIIVVLFCLGSLPYVDFTTYASGDSSLLVVNGGSGFMKALPLACWFYIGVEALSLASDDVAEPRKAIPLGQASCIATLVVTAVAVFFVTVSLPPGLIMLPTTLVPFNNGFENLFRIPQATSTLLSLPATYATAFGFMWCYGKLIAAMAQSRLLPPVLARLTTSSRTPYMALIAGSLVSYGLCMAVYWVPAVSKSLYNICMLSAMMAYTGQCVGYISLKTNYRNIKSSQYKSPFGIPGAIVSISIWLLNATAVIGFQANGHVEIIVFGSTLLGLTIFYFTVAKKKQTFSSQENKILLVAHVMKFNGRKGLGKRPPTGGSNSAASKNRPSRHTNGGASVGRSENGSWKRPTVNAVRVAAVKAR